MSTERSPLLERDSNAHSRNTGIRHGRRPLLAEDSDDEAAASSSTSSRGSIPGDLEGAPTSRAKKTSRKRASTSLYGLTVQRQCLKAILIYLVVSLAVLLLLALAGTHLIAGRLLSRVLEDPQGLQKFGQRSMMLSGPFGVAVQEVTDEAVTLRVSGRAGVDVRAGLAQEEFTALGQKTPQPRKGREGSTWVNRVQDGMLRWGVQRAGHMRIDATSQQVQLMAAHRHPLFSFATVQALESIALPLHYSRNSDRQSESSNDSSLDWLEEFDVPVQLRLQAPDDLVKLALESWTIKQVNIIAKLPHTRVSFDGFWPRLFGRFATMSLKDLSQALQFEGVCCVPMYANVEVILSPLFLLRPTVPNLSFLRDPAQLVSLNDYAVQPKTRKDGSSRLAYAASATVQNPLVTRFQEFPEPYQSIIQHLGDPKISIPWSLSADAYLLAESKHHSDNVNFSRATLRPFDFHLKQPSVDLHIVGQVKPESSPHLDPALSSLLSNYLAGQETPFKVHPAPVDPRVPQFLADLLNHMPLISLKLPGSPDPDAQLLQNVAIQHMHLDGTGPNSEMMVSGTVVGDLVLPSGLEGLASALQIKSLWPDVLVFDGSPSWTLDHKSFPPDPLPRGAFARLSPQDWTHVATTPSEDGGGLHIEMQLQGVPMKVLPGRGDLFRGYVAKVIFGTGDGPEGQVRTGIWGFADAKAEIQPVPPLTLEDVLVQGEFFVSKSGVLAGWQWS